MKIAVYCGASTGFNEIYTKVAKELGEWIATNQHKLIYGGGNIGLMKAVSDALINNNGYVTGVMPTFLVDREIHRSDLSEFIEVTTMAERKAMMLDETDICIALPGGPGTLEEISEAISLARVSQIDSVCVFLNINGYYDHLEHFFNHMLNEGFISREDHANIHFVDQIEDLARFS